MRITQLGYASFAALLVLAGCGTPSAPRNSDGYGMIASRHAEAPVEASTTNAEPTNPDATFKGCWFKQGKNHYQAVDISVKNAGSYPFNAYLYYGTTCNPNDTADQIGYGEDLDFGGFDYTFWFDRFANKKDMSALWYVGSDKSVCVNYETAPNC
ncbi:MAG: hypothetical protein ABR874_21820 [Candidatus Sulfotelmatobacter sp.]|jgi:hypothetical protein